MFFYLSCQKKKSLKRWNILGTLIKLINPETNTQWQTKQYCKILHIIVSISTLVTQNMIDEFIKYNGPIVYETKQILQIRITLS